MVVLKLSGIHRYLELLPLLKGGKIIKSNDCQNNYKFKFEI